jgi:hypothetical protein
MTNYHINDVVSLVWQIPCCKQTETTWIRAQARTWVSHGGSCRGIEMRWCHVRLCCCLYSAAPVTAKPEISKELRDVQTVAFRSKYPRRVGTHGSEGLAALRGCMAICSVRRRLVERSTARSMCALLACHRATQPMISLCNSVAAPDVQKLSLVGTACRKLLCLRHNTARLQSRPVCWAPPGGRPESGCRRRTRNVEGAKCCSFADETEP